PEDVELSVVLANPVRGSILVQADSVARGIAAEHRPAHVAPLWQRRQESKSRGAEEQCSHGQSPDGMEGEERAAHTRPRRSPQGMERISEPSPRKSPLSPSSAPTARLAVPESPSPSRASPQRGANACSVSRRGRRNRPPTADRRVSETHGRRNS